MIKPLLFILVIVMISALALNFDFFLESSSIQKSIKVPIVKVEKVRCPNKEEIIILVKKTKLPINNLGKELQELLKKAQELFQKNQDAEALLIYEEIIEKSKDAKEVKILKLFAEACFKKATIHYIYPNYDIDSTIESYELIISKFEDQENKELLVTYMQARLQQAQFISKDETLLAYDELIEKFQNDKEERFEKEIENMLFSKSFALMGVNDEEAIEVLDSIITKYSDKTKLPEIVKFSILNNIELSIITSNETEKYVDLAKEYMSDSPDTKPLLDMLSIIKNAQDLEQSEALERWNKEHKKYIFPNWDFAELRKWVNNMEIPESQHRIRQYLDVFEKQKYKNIYQTPAVSIPINPNYSNTEKLPIYEENPYLNDINPSLY